MKYIVCSYMFPDVETDISMMKNPPSVSVHKYTFNLLIGLIQNNQNITVINTPRILSFPNYPNIFIYKNSFTVNSKKIGINTGFINLPILSYISRLWTIKRELKKELKKHKDEKIVLIYFNSFFPVNLAMAYARRRFGNVHLCGVIGDLSGEKSAISGGKGLRWRIFNALEKYAENISRQSDAFVLLTRYMAEALNVTDKPFCIIEGMYSETIEKLNNTKYDEKLIFYAGAISREYGLIHLLNAFSLINGAEYRLLLAGGGNAVEEINRFAANDERIVYLGYLTPSEVEKYQQSATVLVNPRTSEHSFVKYSFPSKNMECLASGKPYIAHDLICNPDEYRAYIQYPADESDEALANKIVDICCLPKEKRDEIGVRARQFILTQKNPKIQCKKITDMMNKLQTNNYHD